MKIEISICTGLMLNDHSNPYIESTTVLSDYRIYSRRYLAQPRRGGQRWSLMSVVKRQLEDESFQRDSCLPRLHSSDPMQYLAKCVSAKLEEGDYRGAVRIACSEDAIADITDATISSLREKHPGPHPESHIPSPPQPEEFVPLPAITEEEVASAIRSFPRGSAGGPDGIRPQHLLNLTSASAELGGENLLRALTAFTNLILHVPQSVKPDFLGGGDTSDCGRADTPPSGGEVCYITSHAFCGIWACPPAVGLWCSTGGVKQLLMPLASSSKTCLQVTCC